MYLELAKNSAEISLLGFLQVEAEILILDILRTRLEIRCFLYKAGKESISSSLEP